jgi:DnaJ-class molecular chaperone
MSVTVCPECGGAGEFWDSDGVTMRLCPSCDGAGTITDPDADNAPPIKEPEESP